MAEPAPPQGPTTLRVPEGDNRERLVCASCGFVLYRNPKVVVGAVIEHDARLVLCRRAIDPRKGFWTIPAGYLELAETTAEGARREAREEAGAEIAIEGTLAVYSIPRISQVQVIYAARLAKPGIAPGPETLEARLAPWADIPWDELAFPSVRWALNHWRERVTLGDTAARTNPPGESGDY
ncbi:MAG: NUDIX hydrolase [Alphaproteobacteria bacterium]